MDRIDTRAFQVTAPEAAFGRVLAGTDGSERASEAVRRAGRIASLTGSRLDIVFVVDTGHAHDGEDVERNADVALASAAEAARAEGAHVGSRIVAGNPARALIDEAMEHGAGLLVVGADAGVLAGAIAVGRVASQVLRHAPVSVMVGRASRGPFPARIDCGVDSSRSSVRAAGLAGAIAAAAGAELRLRHVTPVYGDAGWTLASADDDSAAEFAGAAAAVRTHGVEPVLEAATGRPERALAESAEREAVDLIVVGRGERSAVARTFLGSVSEHVALHASCSVLVARPAED